MMEKYIILISYFLKIASATVAYWVVHSDPDNLDSFLEGNFRKVTKEYEYLLLEIVDQEPTEYGYELGRFSCYAANQILWRSASGKKIKQVGKLRRY